MERSDHFPDSFHRVTIKGFCVRDGKLLLIRESENLSGSWVLPGGGLDFGENIQIGFEREVSEEMGLRVTKMSRQPVYAWTSRFENARNLDWYYALALGYRVEFEHLDFTPTDECAEIRFFSKEELENLDFYPQTRDFINIFSPDDFESDFLKENK